ncbi:hypothetical protein BDN71DRAFT_1513121 [Pleurotus eryngii]|uniref:F-box domain-containing protein n=1 Tax=Pleurotus eryngii TaxID=5323 RepID=A0A9P5ZHU6_PLEER|nr:hypothetical protein BDN71DRAFT_1513121 [Pleurotus eryngii]
MAIIPQEILREIIATVNDTPSLFNCLLVCKSFQFQDEARCVLYQSVALVATGQRLQKFHHAIDVNPLNAQLIKRIAFSHAHDHSTTTRHEQHPLEAPEPQGAGGQLVRLEVGGLCRISWPMYVLSVEIAGVDLVRERITAPIDSGTPGHVGAREPGHDYRS